MKNRVYKNTEESESLSKQRNTYVEEGVEEELLQIMDCRKHALNAFVVFVVYCITICYVPNVACSRRINSPAAFYVFGDSLADSGNNNFIYNTTSRANFPPYGETYFHRPTGRFTNGRTVLDFLASRLKLPFPPPYLKPGADFSRGINFASGGSGLLLSTGKTLNIIPLDLQIQQFANISSSLVEKYGSVTAKSFLSRSIYAISTGGNDFGLNYLVNATFQNSTTPEAFIKLLLEKYTDYLTKLYTNGARNFILFDLSTLGCTPNFRLAGVQTWNGECVEIANQMVEAYNARFKQLMSNMTKVLKEATILTTNSYEFAINVTQRGQDYGFLETRYACCGAGPFNTAVSCGKEIPKDKVGEYKAFLCKDPSTYMFWDGTHPTERFYKLIAHQVWNANSAFISPFNLKALVSKLNRRHV